MRSILYELVLLFLLVIYYFQYVQLLMIALVLMMTKLTRTGFHAGQCSHHHCRFY